MYENYGARAKLAEQSQGVDWKALSHAVRVGTEAMELLTTGNITFPRPDAPYLVMIKTGKIPYKTVAEDIEVLLESVEQASASSILAEYPNQVWMDTTVLLAHLGEVKKEIM
jgi:hypothetical protein